MSGKNGAAEKNNGGVATNQIPSDERGHWEEGIKKIPRRVTEGKTYPLRQVKQVLNKRREKNQHEGDKIEGGDYVNLKNSTYLFMR